jgi:DNA repair protein SbcD/Mre11
MFKFIHTADIHLDSPLRGLSAYEGAPVELLRGATRVAFRNLVDLAIREEVAFMVIAGDLYDGTWRDYQTGLFLVSEMARLRAVGIRAVILYGNHDAESEITSRLSLPDNVSIFRATRPQTFKFNELKVALHGQSFRTPAVTDNLIPGYPEPLAGWFNIGVLHTALEGNTEHANYAPCSTQELVAKGYDYWALGHVHEHEMVSEDPWIVFPGNLQGRHARELGPRGAVLVTVDDGRIQSVERVFTDVLRWNHVTVDVSPATTLEHATDLVRQSLSHAIESEKDGRSLAVRVTLAGQTRLHGELFEDEPRFAADVRALAVGSGGDRIWIEKVRIETSGLPEPGASHSDAIGELETLLSEAARDPALLATLQDQLSGMLNRLPPELRNAQTPELSAIRDGRVADIAEAMRPAVTAWLQNPR